MAIGSAVDDPAVAREAESPEALLARYEGALLEAVEITDSTTLDEVGVDDGAVEAVRSGEAGDLDVATVAAVFASAGGDDPDATLADIRDALLLEMSSAMLTVDRIAADVDGEFDPKEIQAKIEGRHPMTLAEYAQIFHYVAGAT